MSRKKDYGSEFPCDSSKFAAALCALCAGLTVFGMVVYFVVVAANKIAAAMP